MTGERTSAPIRDQVPEEIKADRGVRLTAATAEPVSWQAGAITGASTRELRAGPRWVPGCTISASRCVGIPRRSRSAVAQPPERGSNIWVVVALVNSQQTRPVSQ